MLVEILTGSYHTLKVKVNEFINNKEYPKKIIDIKFTSYQDDYFAAMVIYEYIKEEK